MSLNPIVILSEQLQKLINEHGSSAILRDHLAFIKDQALALEKKVDLLTRDGIDLTHKASVFIGKNSQLESEKKNIEIEAQNLRAEIEDLKNQNERLREEFKEYRLSRHVVDHNPRSPMCS